MSRITAAVLALLLVLMEAVSASVLPDIPIVLPDGRRVAIDSKAREALPEVRVRATSHGEVHEYTGVNLLGALKAAGLDPAESLRGKALALVLVAEGADGYRVTFALAELDPSIGNKQVLLVHEMDGRPLPEGAGPWRLVVPSDSRPTRWIWGLTGLAVRQVE